MLVWACGSSVFSTEVVEQLARQHAAQICAVALRQRATRSKYRMPRDIDRGNHLTGADFEGEFVVTQYVTRTAGEEGGNQAICGTIGWRAPAEIRFRPKKFR